jgi:very-short-patch-repair endonuclease
MKYENLDDKIEKLQQKAWDAIMEDIYIVPDYQLSELQPKCENPIERLLTEALCMMFTKNHLCDGGHFIGDSDWMIGPPQRYAEVDLKKRVGETNFIDTQVEVGKYRADIIVWRWEHMASETWLKTPPVIIECDGHDFHERTKEQAQRDKLRDRELQQEGYCVLRFTGSEIWRDAWACAQQVNEFLQQKIRAAYAAS